MALVIHKRSDSLQSLCKPLQKNALRIGFCSQCVSQKLIQTGPIDPSLYHVTAYNEYTILVISFHQNGETRGFHAGAFAAVAGVALRIFGSDINRRNTLESSR